MGRVPVLVVGAVLAPILRTRRLRRHATFRASCASVLAFVLAAGASGCATTSLKPVPADARVFLPDDHGPHADAQTEWWHLHADARDVETGEPLHVFAGFVVQRTDLDRVAGLPVAPVVNPYHLAYLQVVDAGGTARGARYGWPVLRKPRFAGSGLDLRQGGWRIARDGGSVSLEASAGGTRIALRADAAQPATLPSSGAAVELAPGTRHLWYQEEGMRVSGRWQQGRRVRWVEGTGFFKHQWGRLYTDDVTGFVWLSGDLEDGRSFVVVRVFRTDVAPTLLAWVSDRGGAPVPLDVDAIELTPEATWRSPATGRRWPVAWSLTGAGFDLVVRSVHDAQELAVFPGPMHVGPARATGTVDGAAVDGVVFVEQVGGPKDHPLRFLFRSEAPR